jgi:hypothetical protein
MLFWQRAKSPVRSSAVSAVHTIRVPLHLAPECVCFWVLQAYTATVTFSFRGCLVKRAKV